MPGKPKGLSCRDDVLSRQELDMLLLASSSFGDKLIICCLVFGGLGVGELKHLRRSRVNVEEGTITIPTKQTCGY